MKAPSLLCGGRGLLQLRQMIRLYHFPMGNVLGANATWRLDDPYHKVGRLQAFGSAMGRGG
jgi:hypothetical protein